MKSRNFPRLTLVLSLNEVQCFNHYRINFDIGRTEDQVMGKRSERESRKKEEEEGGREEEEGVEGRRRRRRESK